MGSERLDQRDGRGKTCNGSSPGRRGLRLAEEGCCQGGRTRGEGLNITARSCSPTSIQPRTQIAKEKAGEKLEQSKQEVGRMRQRKEHNEQEGVKG